MSSSRTSSVSSRVRDDSLSASSVSESSSSSSVSSRMHNHYVSSSFSSSFTLSSSSSSHSSSSSSSSSSSLLDSLRDDLTPVVVKIGTVFGELSKIWEEVKSKLQEYIECDTDLETRRMTIKTLSSVYTCNYVFLVPFVNACLNEGGKSHHQFSIEVLDRRNFGNILHQQLRGKISVVLILVVFSSSDLF